MRELIRNKEVCGECGRLKFRQEYVYTCDNDLCGKEIDSKTAQKYNFDYAFESDGYDTHKIHACSMKCLMIKLKDYSHYKLRYFNVMFFNDSINDLVKLIEELKFYD